LAAETAAVETTEMVVAEMTEYTHRQHRTVLEVLLNDVELYQRGFQPVSSISETRIMWNITMEGCIGDRPRSPGFDVLKWRGKVDNMDEVDGSHDAYSHRGSSQMGGNHQLLRVYVDYNVTMTGVGMCFRDCMCHQNLSIYSESIVKT
jgi:hypothetical protein